MMISRRSLITKAPVAAAAVAGGGLLLPRPAAAHKIVHTEVASPIDADGDVVDGATNLQSAYVSDWIGTGSRVNIKTWQQDGERALIMYEGTDDGAVIGKALTSGEHVDVWYDGIHCDIHRTNTDNRRLLIEDGAPVITDIEDVGLDDVARFADLEETASDTAQMRVVQSIATGTYYYIADFFRGDRGWRRRIFVLSATGVTVMLEVMANVADFESQIQTFLEVFVAAEFGFVVSVAATMGGWAAIGSGFGLAAICYFGSYKAGLLNRRAIQLDRLYPYFVGTTSFNPTPQETRSNWPEGVQPRIRGVPGKRNSAFS